MTASIVAGGIQQCKYWQLCMTAPSSCGGFTRTSKLGSNGTNEAPSNYELHRLIWDATWSDGMKKKDCAFHPICDKKAWDCGGSQKS